MKTLYFESTTGISGDMTVGALLDLGADRKVLEQGLSSLGLQGYTLKFGRTKKSGIDAFDFDVILEREAHAHSHGEHNHSHGEHSHSHGEHSHSHGEHSHSHGEHNHSHGEHSHSHGEHSHSHGEHNHSHGEHSHSHGEHNHSHGEHSHSHGEHSHSHGEHSHSHGEHHHRGLTEILRMIESASISPRAKEFSSKVFHIIAGAESKAHGIPVEEVHFHEVGAVDSIVDVVGAAICLDNLDADRVISSPLGEGEGYVRCAHGKMPVPVPAVVNIAQANNVPLRLTGIEGELVTPTGIAIISAAAESFSPPSQMIIQKVGYGAGTKDIPGYANLLRVYLLDEPDRQDETVTMIESNIDDCTPEVIAFACEQMMEVGALDVWQEPVMMKKGRAAVKLCVLCDPADHEKFTKMIFAGTTSIGVRKSNLQRTIMQRSTKTVGTCYGEILCKQCSYGTINREYVEYESAKAAARQHHVTIQQVIDETKRKICD